MATPSGNSVPLTGNPYLDGLSQGSSWSFPGTRVLSYSLNNIAEGSIWTAPEIAAVDKAFDAWEAVANVTFTRWGGPNQFEFFTSPADLALGFTGNYLSALIEPGTLGYAIFPSAVTGNQFLNDLSILVSQPFTRSEYPHPEGDIFIDDFSPSWYPYIFEGDYGSFAIIHEIGHALGLKHPHDNGGQSDHKTFAQLGIGELDSQFYTVMSYIEVPGAGPDYGHPVTPMFLDILAIQAIYGPNMSYHKASDIYVLADDGALRTIWDAGGRDKFDASNINHSVLIDLDQNLGTFNLGGAVLGDYSGVGIAFGVTIEDATGGAGSDEIIGNVAANSLIGNAGNDSISGLAGNDLLVGGAGNDILNGGNGNDAFGGSIGNDKLAGGAGNDTLDGGPGNDSLNGGTGRDIFLFNAPLGASSVDTIAGFVHADDTIRLDDDIFTALGQAANTVLTAAHYKENATGVATDSSDRIIYNTTNGSVFYDRDGNGPTAAVKFAVIAGGPDEVDQTDFFVVG